MDTIAEVLAGVKDAKDVEVLIDFGGSAVLVEAAVADATGALTPHA
jgi:hypothetical protein